MNSEEYAEKLKDPMWQKVRGFMLWRDSYTCQKCGAKQEWGYELHVHHKRYIAGREPWQYGTDDLTTLCKQCHCKEHGIKYEQKVPWVHVSVPMVAFIKRLEAAMNSEGKS